MVLSSKTMQISAVILTKNNERLIGKVLTALAKLDEVIIVDNGSYDQTLEIAKDFPNVKIYCKEFCGFGTLRNYGASLAQHDWILTIDSDEVISAEATEEISKVTLNPNVIYSFPFHNYYNGRWIRCCGWYPDRHIRLYNRNKTSFTTAYVHEGIILKPGMEEDKLKSPILHYSYTCISDFLNKMQRYSDLFAQQHQHKKSSSLPKAIAHGLFAFFKHYILKRGIFWGYEGFIISIYNANTAFYKYLKLAERNRQN
ncbi:MAG: waaE [Chlamydiales bacterium]|jgi:glycosyltransferase involved in cell wall biosynthesis|nr:waaE [Chlamydiales bacterium]